LDRGTRQDHRRLPREVYFTVLKFTDSIAAAADEVCDIAFPIAG